MDHDNRIAGDRASAERLAFGSMRRYIPLGDPEINRRYYILAARACAAPCAVRPEADR